MDRRLTFSLETGEWGLKGHDIKQVPGRLMGFLYKLHAYEKIGLSPDEVERLKENVNGEGWIPCMEKLPPEPDGNMEPMTAQELEQLIEGTY